jgi:hypothetical protein
MTMNISRVFGLVWFAACTALSLHAQNEAAAFVDVPGWKAPAPGEHPRLIFRKADLPALRQRAETPEGKEMITHLKVLLGGGEVMPTQFSQEKPVNSVDEAAVTRQPIGTFTLSHAAGFGMLYLLTGDKKYADLSRQCVDKIFAGQVDRDSRYNWTSPGTGFRLGFVLQSICLSYDLCADAWPADYKKQVVERVLAMHPPSLDKTNVGFDLERLANADGYPPGSNHYGPYLLGPGLVALTFKNDPGADNTRLDALQKTVEENLCKLLGKGFGDHGWHAEGTSCGRIGSNTGVIPLIQSLKVAAGKDYISPRPDARFTALRLVEEIVPRGDKPTIPHRGGYGDDELNKRQILSHMGDFAQGTGSVLPREAQAIAWIYDHFVAPGEKKSWDATVYPHLMVYSFVNWPDKATDPNDILPKAFADNTHGYYVARNRWKDGDDVLVTTLLMRGPRGYKSKEVKPGTMVWGYGERFNFGTLLGKTTHYRASADGSMELADEKGNALVVDFSGSSGAPALLATLGDVPVNAKKGVATVLPLGDVKVTLLTLSEGTQPPPAVSNNVITLGKQTIKLDDGHLSLGTFNDSKRSLHDLH